MPHLPQSWDRTASPSVTRADIARAESNARLIDAAPEMLAALKMAVRFLDHPEVIAIPFAGSVVELARQIRATIDKAEGRESQEVSMK